MRARVENMPAISGWSAHLPCTLHTSHTPHVTRHSTRFTCMSTFRSSANSLNLRNTTWLPLLSTLSLRAAAAAAAAEPVIADMYRVRPKRVLGVLHATSAADTEGSGRECERMPTRRYAGEHLVVEHGVRYMHLQRVREQGVGWPCGGHTLYDVGSGRSTGGGGSTTSGRRWRGDKASDAR
jgi:hypothetical protein